MRGKLLAAAALIVLAGCGTPEASSTNQAAAPIDAQALRAAAGDGPARRFYEARDWRPAWSAEAGGAGARHRRRAAPRPQSRGLLGRSGRRAGPRGRRN